MSKLGILVGFGAGYVLGARAGRERYDQLMGKAQQVWRDPRVQAKTSQAQEAAQEKASQAAGVAQEKASQAAAAVKEKVGDKLGDGDGAGGSSATGGPGAATPPASSR